MNFEEFINRLPRKKQIQVNFKADKSRITDLGEFG